MRRQLIGVLSSAVLVVPIAAVWAAPARADEPTELSCARTMQYTNPNMPSDATPGPTNATPGNPCWTDVTPYPFGYQGIPIDSPPTPLTAPCGADVTGSEYCYLTVQSLAFRAWNRGLAAVSGHDGPLNASQPTQYVVWRYNGTRWYPDPTFPGPTVCPGTKILWAGKLDYWLVGSAPILGNNTYGSSTLCRFDGVNDDWEPLTVPPAPDGTPVTITTGACFAWSNCWFFGNTGAVVHWDGQSLSDVSVGLGPNSSWLMPTYADAVAATDPNGNPFALAVAQAPLHTQPDGSAAPELFASTGEQFSPLAFSPPTGNSGAPGTDLDAIAFDSEGDGWVAGNPADIPSIDFPGSSDYLAPSPLVAISSSGTAICPGASQNSFMYSANGASTSYLWSSIGVMPGGDAVAGGDVGLKVGGNLGQVETEPVLAQVSCDQAPQITEFRIPDPTLGGLGNLVPADQGAEVTAIAASASNDAWGATDGGTSDVRYATSGETLAPHLYQYTDGQTPDAPAGNDIEPRPLPTSSEPTIFEFAPPVVVPPPPGPTTSVTTAPRKHKTIKLKPAVYDIAKPHVVPAAAGAFKLSISFRVRRKVRIGLEAIRHGKVVSKSGLKTFTGTRGTLAVTLTRATWPTGLKFVQPKKK